MSTFPPEPPTADDGQGTDPFATPPGTASSPPPSSAPPPPPPPPSAPGGYGAPPQPGDYSQAGYGQQPYGAGPGNAVAGNYAAWPKRALSGLIDYIGPSIVANIFYQANRPLGVLLILAALAWGLYNAYLGGQTGQSYGKKIAGTRLVMEATGEPIGGGLGIGRYFVHILDALPCYLGYLWPLWDSKRQTFADKILKTVVTE